jgi:hypothetical protein
VAPPAQSDRERILLALIAERVAGPGRRGYGAPRLATDGRDFRREAAEEVADALFYAACGLVMAGGPWGASHGAEGSSGQPEGRMTGAERGG